MAGDVTEPDLGMSAEDRAKLLEEVTIVFHSAATVKFNESLDTAVTLNTIGTQRVLLFCRQMKNLKVRSELHAVCTKQAWQQINVTTFQALIHVSTAYSNADKEEILETVYPVPANVFGEIKSNELLSEELLKEIGRKLQRKHPNTYTVTKAMAEWVVAEYCDDIAAAIVRPSIGKFTY